ncbi:MAG: hypothetical protein ACE5ID_03400, partial [Acidobacteriota bacterium]
STLTRHRSVWFPRLGFRQGRRLFLPASAVPEGAGPILALVRIVGLPDGGKVRFCLGAGGAKCVGARLRREEIPEDQRIGPVWSAWVALDQETAGQAAHLRAEVLDETGGVVAHSGGQSSK